MTSFARRFSMLKVAAALAVVAILISTGWAAEKIYQKFFSDVSVTLERWPTREWTLPDGTKLTTSGEIGTSVASGDPKAIETAKRHHEEMKQLLAQKKYEFIKTFEFRGEKEYVYRFTFADGAHDTMNFSMPLDHVVSWDDYRQKAAQEEKRRHEQINKALAAGRFRLIDSDVMLMHICREIATNQKYQILRIVVPECKEKDLYRETAQYRPFDFKDEEKVTTMPETSWQDYLDAVREGKWELLDEERTPTYEYEVVLDNGSKTIFQYGGGKPLEKPKAK